MPRREWLIFILLFGVLVAANNCGGGGGGEAGSSGSSLLDSISANSVQVTTYDQTTDTLLGNVALILTEEANDLNKRVAQTSDAGIYTFGNVRLGTYKVTAVKPGYNETTGRVIVTDGPQKLVLSLSTSFPPTSVSGVVTNVIDGSPVADVAVEVKDVSPVISSRTNQEGIYTLENVQNGTYTLKASKNGYATTERSNVRKLPNIALTGMDFQLSPTGTAEVKLPGKIRGIVRDESDNQPLQGVTVIMKGSALGAFTTDGQGYYNFDNVEAGVDYILTAYTTAPARKGSGDAVVTSYYQVYAESTRVESGNILLKDIKMKSVPKPDVPVTATLVGRVQDAVSSTYLSGVSVAVVGTGFSATTDTTGSFSLAGISPGVEFIYVFSQSGYFSSTHTQALATGYNTLSLPNKTIGLQPLTSTKNKATIVGTVTDEYNGSLLPNVTVEVLNTNLKTTTNESGAYLIADIPVTAAPTEVDPTADITVVYAKDKYRTVTRNETVNGGKTKQLTFQSIKRMTGNIIVTVFDSTTQSTVNAASVTFQGFTPKNGQVSAATVSGRATFSDIPLGTYNFTISHEEYASTTISGIVISQDFQTVNASAYLNKDIINVEGYIYSEENTIDGFQSGTGGDSAIAGVTVKIEVESIDGGVTGQALSQTSGYYRISNLPLGARYIISTEGSGALGTNYRHEQKEISLNAGSNRADVGLYRTTGVITGFVFQDDNGDGIFSNEPLVANVQLDVSNLTDAQTDIVTTGFTDQNGAFLISNVKAGSIKINVSKTEANYESTFSLVTMPEGQNVSDVAIPIKLKSTTISGQVLDAATSKAIQGVKVSIIGHSGITSITDASGAFRLTSVPLTPISKILLFDAEALGYGIQTRTGVSVQENQPTILDTPEQMARSTRMIYGTVVNSRNGAGVSDMNVRLTYSEGASEILNTTTLASGGFSFDSVVTSDSAIITLDVTDNSTLPNGKARYQSAIRTLTVTAGDAPLKITPDIPVVPNFTTIRGFVLENSTNLPVNTSAFTTADSRIKVELVETGTVTTVSLLDGSFLIRDIPAGEAYTLRVFHDVTSNPLFNNVFVNMTTTTGGETNAGIIYITLKKATVTGLVREFNGTTNVSGALVTATSSGLPGFSATATSDVNGNFTMKVPPYDNYSFTVSKTAYQTLSYTTDEVKLDGMSLLFDLVAKTGTISGTVYFDENGNGVLDPGDKPVHSSQSGAHAGIGMQIYYVYKGVERVIDMNVDSTYTLTDVPIGSRYLFVRPTDPTSTNIQPANWRNPADTTDYTVEVTESSSDPATSDFLVKLSTHQTGTLKGVVVDSTTGLTVEGATVTLKDTSYTTVTDSTGFWLITGIQYYNGSGDPSTNFFAAIEKTGYVGLITNQFELTTGGAPQDLTLSDAQPKISPIQFVIRKEAGNISGNVFNSETKAAIADATVKIVNNGYEFTTDAQGNFDFKNVGPVYLGTYTLQVNAQFHASKTISGVTISQNSQEVILNIGMTRQYGTVKGYVYQEVNKVSGYQAGADIALGSQNIEYISATADPTTDPDTTTTDGNGYYEIPNLAVGSYDFVFAAPADAGGFDTEAAAATHSQVQKVINVGDQQIVQQDVELVAINGALTGIVYADENGNGVRDSGEKVLPGATVTLNQGADSGEAAVEASANGDGTYTLALPAGTLPVVVSFGGGGDEQGGDTTSSPYYEISTYVQILPGGNTAQDWGLVPIKGTISGRVLDAVTLLPVEGAKVLIEATNIVTLTDSNGDFTLSNVPIVIDTENEPNNVIVDYIAGGYVITRVDPAVPYPTADIQNYRLGTPILLVPSTRVVSGRVVSAKTGNGIQNATINIQAFDGSVLTANSAKDGYFTVLAVPVKTFEDYEATVFQDEYETKIVSFFLAPGTGAYTITPDVSLNSTRGEITGRVLDRTTGWPVQTAAFTVQALLKEPGSSTAAQTLTVGNDGYFTFQNVPKGGPFTITFQSSTGTNQFFRDIVTTSSVSGGQTSNLGVIYIDLEPIRVSGIVLDLNAPNSADLNNLYYGVNGASITCKHPASGYTVTTTTNNLGSFEIDLLPLVWNFSASATNYNTGSRNNIDISALVDRVVISIRPQTGQINGRVYFDENNDGDADLGTDDLIFDYPDGQGLFQGEQLKAYYIYRGLTFEVDVRADSSFQINDVPVGDRIIYASGADFASHYWISSTNPADNLVTVSVSGSDPSSVDIALTAQQSAYGSISGLIGDKKILEGYRHLHPGLAADALNSILRSSQYRIPGITIKAISETYSTTTTSDAEGYFFLKLPTGPADLGREYLLEFSDGGLQYQTHVTGPVRIVKAGTTGNVAQILGTAGWVNIGGNSGPVLNVNIEPRMGSMSGTIIYDNDVVNSSKDSTDYNHVPNSNEFPVNAVFGHPQPGNSWSNISFSIFYNYRGLTFGSTMYERSNSIYNLAEIPVGSYYFYARDGIANDADENTVDDVEAPRNFFTQVYTVNGTDPEPLTISETVPLTGINFAMMVRGGHLVAIGSYTEANNGLVLDAQGNPLSTSHQIVGSGYSRTTGAGILPEELFVRFPELGLNWPFTSESPLIEIISYPVDQTEALAGIDPLIIPPGTYTIILQGAVDLSTGASPTEAMTLVTIIEENIEIEAGKATLWQPTSP